MECAVHALRNAAAVLGIDLSYDEARLATRFRSNIGGSLTEGAQYMARTYGVEVEEYPKGTDLIWSKVAGDLGRSIASPVLNGKRLFREYGDRLRDGWVAVAVHRWGTTEEFHAVALVGVESDSIRVRCSMRGDYLAGDRLFRNDRGGLQCALGTWWMRRKEGAR